MVKKQVTKGIIEQKQEELVAILEQQAENVRQYKALWEERNNCLEAGEVLKAQELEGKYYRMRDVIGKQLDNKRIELDKEVEELQAEAYRLKNKLKVDARVLYRQQQELQALKKEYQEKLADKQQAILDTEFILEAAEQRISELEGVN